jgi:hypothetical protein
MWQAKLVTVGMCCIILTGCPDQKSAAPSASQTAPPIASGTAIVPQSIPESEVESLVNKKLSGLNDAIDYKRCTNGLPVTNQPPAAGIAAAFGDGPKNYAIWLKYIADHIAKGTSFGSDYSPLADSVFSDFTPLEPTSFACQNLNLKDVVSLSVWKATTPDSVGKSIFEIFAQYDQATQQLAAQYLRSVSSTTTN